VAGFADELTRFGYTPCSLEQHVCFIAHLDRWLAAEQLSVGDLTAAVVDRYLSARRAAGHVNYRSIKAMRPLLSYLSRLGVLPAGEALRVGPVQALLARAARCPGTRRVSMNLACRDTKASLLSRSLPRDRVHDVNLFPNLGVAGVDDVERRRE
jgi:hypothetical protein